VATRVKTVRLLVLLLLTSLAPLAPAQNPIAPRGAERSPDCLPSASRAKASCEPTQVVVHTEQEITFSLEIPAPKTSHCAASIELGYSQRDTVVNVEGTIENKDCGASQGEYKLAVRIRDENRELKTLEFFESWQRLDSEPVRFEGVHSIGENVDLVSVRSIQLSCTCTATPAE
jgi:hypothetical protein